MKNEKNPQKRLTRRERAVLERKKVCRLLGVLLAVAILAAAIGNLTGKDKKFSENENRMLAQKPQVTWEGVKDGSLFRDLKIIWLTSLPVGIGGRLWISRSIG